MTGRHGRHGRGTNYTVVHNYACPPPPVGCGAPVGCRCITANTGKESNTPHQARRKLFFNESDVRAANDLVAQDAAKQAEGIRILKVIARQEYAETGHAPGFILADKALRMEHLKEAMIVAWYILDRDVDKFMDGMARTLVELDLDDKIFNRNPPAK